MASVITAVYKATVGWLVNKGRDLAADKLKEGDVTEQQFRNMIVRELDDIKTKLDGLARKDLLTSISFFKEGIVFLYKVMDTASGDQGTAATEQGATAGMNTVSLVWRRENMLLHALNETGRNALSKAKERFNNSRIKATEAFNNVALSTSDRILAMQYRVMSTILEEIDNPKEAISACKLCLEELHAMPAVIKSFKIQETGGFWSLFQKDEREEVLESVRDVNHVIFTVTEVVDGVLSREFESWPCVDIGEKEVNVLKQNGDSAFNSRVLLTWWFGQGEEDKEHNLRRPHRITANTQGQFIVAEISQIKVFSCEGKFLYSLTISDELGNFLAGNAIIIKDVATDREDNVYVLSDSDLSSTIHVFDKQGKMCRYFRLGAVFQGISLTVTADQTVFVLVLEGLNCDVTVQVYKSDGRFVNSFRHDQVEDLRFSSRITAAHDNQIMISKDRLTRSDVLLFDSKGNHLRTLPVQFSCSGDGLVMTFHPPSERLLIVKRDFLGRVKLLTYTKDGNYIRTIFLGADRKYAIRSISGVTATTEGHIAVLCTFKENENESDKAVVLVA